MSKAIDLKKGNIIKLPDHNPDYLLVVSTEHQKPGKGPAYIQLETKNLRTRDKLNFRLSSSDQVDTFENHTKKATFIYSSGGIYSFTLISEEYEQIEIQEDFFSEKTKKLICENMILDFFYIDDNIVDASLPRKYQYKILKTNPPSKKNSTKLASIQNEIEIKKVPDFIEVGDVVIIDTEELEYLEKYKA